DNQIISLSIKETLPGAWDDILEKAPRGAVLDGTVKRLVAFGAFVEVFPGVEGLVHISQISHKHIGTPHEVLEVGQKIKVKVLDVKPEEQRLSLSIKALEEKEPTETERPARREAPAQRRDRDEDSETETGFTFGDILGSQLSDLTSSDEDDDDEDNDDEDEEESEENDD